VCRFLGRNVPPDDVPWPARHQLDEFHQGVARVVRPAEERAMARIAAAVVAVAVAGLAAWWWWWCLV
jgi:hypothetical protein